MKKYLSFSISLLILSAPLLVAAAGSSYHGLVICSGVKEGDLEECGFISILSGINKLMKYMVLISIPISAGLFAYAGLRFIQGGAMGKQGMLDEAKDMVWHIVWGLVLMLSAVMIVKTILVWLTNDPAYLRLIG